MFESCRAHSPAKVRRPLRGRHDDFRGIRRYRRAAAADAGRAGIGGERLGEKHDAADDLVRFDQAMRLGCLLEGQLPLHPRMQLAAGQHPD